MATYDLDQTQFLQVIAPTFDTATQDQILAYLNNQGIYPGGAGLAAVQISATPPIDAVSAPPPLNIPAQIAMFTATSFTVDTDANAIIKAIIALSQNSAVILTGHENVLLAAGNGNDQLFDDSSGNDELVGGAGNDALNDAGSGNDTLFGGTGNDTLTASGMGTDSLSADAGNDTLTGAGNGTYVLDGGRATIKSSLRASDRKPPTAVTATTTSSDPATATICSTAEPATTAFMRPATATIRSSAAPETTSSIPAARATTSFLVAMAMTPWRLPGAAPTFWMAAITTTSCWRRVAAWKRPTEVRATT